MCDGLVLLDRLADLDVVVRCQPVVVATPVLRVFQEELMVSIVGKRWAGEVEPEQEEDGSSKCSLLPLLKAFGDRCVNRRSNFGSEAAYVNDAFLTEYLADDGPHSN